MIGSHSERLRLVSDDVTCVAIVFGKGFIDNKWFSDVFTKADAKKFIVVNYPKSHEIYIKDDRKNTGGYSKTTKDDLDTKKLNAREKYHEVARREFKKAARNYFTTDDWIEAQDKYILWADNLLGKTCKYSEIGANGIVYPGDD